MHPLLHTLWQAIAGVLVPESLAVDRARSAASRRGVFELVAPRAALLRPGDLIVVRTPGTFYKIFRSAARHKVDHLAIVMENGMFLHVGPPTIRLLPVELLLTPNRRPLVFRPKLEQAELEQLMRSLKSLLGQQYDTVRVYSFVARLAAQAYFGKAFPLRLPAPLGVGAGPPKSASADLVYTNASAIPLASAVWMPKGEGTEPNEAARALAEENKARSNTGGSKRIATIGGRLEEDIDSTTFLNGAAAQVAAASAASPRSLPEGNVPIDDVSGAGGAGTDPGAGAVICTDAILPRLVQASPAWRAALGDPSTPNSIGAFGGPFSGAAAMLRRKLDVFKLRSWSINDVFQLNRLRPDLLQRVHLPHVELPAEFRDLADTDTEVDDAHGGIGRAAKNSGNISVEQARKAASGTADATEKRAAGTKSTPASSSASSSSTAASAAGSSGTAAPNPLAALLDHPLAQQLDAYLRAVHPDLHARSVQLQAVLTQVYSTSSPLFRSLLQLYHYTLRTLPPHMAHAVRLYLLLLFLRQVLSLWRTFTMLRQGVRVTHGVLTTAGGVLTGSRARAARRRRRQEKQERVSSRVKHRAPTPSSRSPHRQRNNRSNSRASSRPQSPSKKANHRAAVAPRSRSRSPAAAQLDKLSEMLSVPSATVAATASSGGGGAQLAAHAARVVAEQMLPGPSAKLVQELLRQLEAAHVEKNGKSKKRAAALALSSDDENERSASEGESADASRSQRIVRSLLSSSVGAFASAPAAVASVAPRSSSSSAAVVQSTGRKRAALKSLAKSGAKVAFPRLSRVVRFGRELHQEQKQAAQEEGGKPRTIEQLATAALQKATVQALQSLPSTALLVPPPSSTSDASSGHSSSASSDDEESSSPSSSRSPLTAMAAKAASVATTAAVRSASPSTQSHTRFAARHPHLASLVEQLKLLLVAAAAAQFVDQLRSAL